MNEKSYAFGTYNLNDFCQQAFYPEISTVHQNNEIKPKAYINPQNINYEYIRNSLSRKPILKVSKIHINPNFGMVENRDSLQNQEQLLIKGKSSLDNLPTTFKGNNLSQSFRSVMPVENSSSKYIFIKQNNLKNNHEELYSCTSKINKSKKKFQLQLKEESKTKFENAKVYEPSLLENQFKYKSKNLVQSSHFKKNLSNKMNCINLSRKKINSHSIKKKINSVNYHKSYLDCNKINSFIRKDSNQFKFISNKNKESVIKLASLVKNKYCRNVALKYIVYKIDKRKNSDKNKVSEKKNHIRKLFPVAFNRSKFYNNLYFNSQYFYSVAARKSLLWRRNKQLEKVPKNKSHTYQNKKIVKIGGIIYKSTSNKLTIANQKNINGIVSNLSDAKKSEEKDCLVVYVRGEKFLLGKNGKTLKRQTKGTNSSNFCFKRIDLGGVTYLQKSQNVLIRTNLHQARFLVNQAKIKSIATLCHLKKKTSLPCMIYHRFGKCIRHSKGLCMYKHDSKNIAICKKFLKGECSNENCLLSHEPTKEKMAECHFFIKGSCNKDSCPFLHVKLNKNTDICKNFLQGYCTFGENCSKRHLSQHPNCNKFRTSSFKAKCSSQQEKKSLKIKKQDENEEVKYFSKNFSMLNDKKEVKRKRPALLQNEKKKNVKKGKISKAKSSQLPNNSFPNSDVLECFPKRIKLDQLPAFIPLNPEN